MNEQIQLEFQTKSHQQTLIKGQVHKLFLNDIVQFPVKTRYKQKCTEYEFNSMFLSGYSNKLCALIGECFLKKTQMILIG